MQVPQTVQPPMGKAETSFAHWLYRKAEKHYNNVNQVFLNAYSVYDLAKDLTALPQPVHVGAKALGYFGVIDLVFSGPRLVSTITNFIQAKDFCGHLNAMLMTASEVSNLASQFTQIIEGLKELNLISPERFAWADKVSYIFMPLQFIFLGQSIEQAGSINNLRRDFEAKFTNPERLASQNARVQNIIRGALHVQEHAACLQSTLYLSKKCALIERSQYLLQRINQAQGDKSALVQEGEEFLGILKNRICTRCTLDVANTIISVVSTVFGVIGLVLPPNPVCATVVAVTTIAGIALAVFDAILLDKNPFQPTTNPWEKKILRPIRQSIYSAASIIYSLVKATLIDPIKAAISPPVERLLAHQFSFLCSTV